MVNLFKVLSFGGKVSSFSANNKVVKTVSKLVDNTNSKTVPIIDNMIKTVVNKDGSMSRIFANGNKVVIAQENGKTVRKVYNQYGQLLLNDTKKFSIAKVGNKTVKIKKVDRSVICSQRDFYDEGFDFSYKADRVYKDHNLIGMRETEEMPAKFDIFKDEKIYRKYSEYQQVPTKRTYVTKAIPDSNKSFVKVYNEDNKVIYKSFINTPCRKVYVGGYKPIYNSGIEEVADGLGHTTPTGFHIGQFGPRVSYNKKGLPLPSEGYALIGIKPSLIENMSLKDMRKEWINSNLKAATMDQRQTNYSAWGMHMEFLNNTNV